MMKAGNKDCTESGRKLVAQAPPVVVTFPIVLLFSLRPLRHFFARFAVKGSELQSGDGVPKDGTKTELQFYRRLGGKRLEDGAQ
jgi:hypothetical protein